MRMLRKLFSLLMVAIFALGLVACSNDNGNEPDSDTPIEPIVFSYDKFFNNDDVIILDADTTHISISDVYFKSVNREIKPTIDKPVPVTIWRTINTAPFVRNVTKVAQEGDRIILTTEHGDLGDVLGDDEFDLDSEIYVDESKSKIASRGASTTINPDRYKDDEGVYHPAVIILDEVGAVAGDETPQSVKSRAIETENVYYTADELAQENVDFRILNVNMGLGNHSLTSPEKYVKIYLKDTYLRAIAGIRISVKTKWFKLKRFECATYGDFALRFTSGAELSVSKSWKKEVDIAKFNAYTNVFWVGPVPVAIKCNVGATMVAEASASAACTIESKVDLSAKYDAGVYYDGRWSSRHSSNAKASADLTKKTGSTFTFKGTAGIEIFMDLKLYDCAGPKVTFGPSLSAEVALETSSTANTRKITTKGGLYLGGKYGVEVKIWKWKLAAWNQKYTAWKDELWNYKKDL